MPSSPWPRLAWDKETTYSTVGLDKWATLLPGNLWGRWSLLPGFDLQYGQAQFGIAKEEPPAITFSLNVWRNVNFDTSYEDTIAVASEFGGDYVFIDVVFEQQQAFKEYLLKEIPEARRKGTIFEKFNQQNMCVVLDWKVNDVWGGEAGLKRLCDRAAAKGVKIISWMSTHASPNSFLADWNHPVTKPMARGGNGVYAGKESGRHPDTGYAASCWTFNLNTPITEWLRDNLIGVCRRTGLAGYLWDSFSNLGWWQVDYSQGDMRPQFDRMGELYAALANAGLYMKPEALVSFSNHSCCGLHGGNIYAGDLLGYSYNTVIALWFNDSESHDSNFENRILRGQAPVDLLFQCLAHKRIPSMNLHLVPRAEWYAPSVAEIKRVLALYKTQRHRTVRRTVLKNGLGVRWDGGDQPVLFAFTPAPAPAGARDAATGEAVATLIPNHAYLLDGRGSTR